MATPNREDYLINILRLSVNNNPVKTSELSEFMDVAPPSVSEMIKILANEGYVNYVKYKGVSLTDSGLEYARQIRKRHHVVERFLTDVLDIDHQTAHEEACRVEHAISDDLAVKMCHMLGTQIDEDCSSCKLKCKASTGESKTTICLSKMKSGDVGVIDFVRGEDSNIMKKLLSMGFVPGRTLEFESKVSEKGPRIVILGTSHIALDYNMANMIYVDVS